ncbi:MAG: valine--tRNA ligase [Gammaproteobacteria bacterium]|nr:valine--tRNA ligase [Gammaproteobacteria bacterium]
MEKAFDPRAVEARWQGVWEGKGWFKPKGSGPGYAIMIPPPNVTGTLHMGHAFQHTLMDALTRYHRMLGDDALWLPGTDHAGIATQMVVERQLAAKGESRLGLGREEFLKRVWAWKEESGGTITRQIRRMGNSVDWSREKFTMDPAYSRAVQEHFVRLYEEGLIYRGKRLVNWDPVLLTAISDLEVQSQEEAGKLWHLRYPLADGSGHLVLATTRPETLLGDTAVAVHPEDERYARLIGRRVRLPLTGREIPVIADTYVDKEFGTGVVKITPAHDFNDYAVGQRHGLPTINIFTPDARINDNGPAAYRGLDRFAAREKVVADLEAQGLLEKVQEHKLMVPRGDRTHAVIEPYLTDQWFLDLTRDTLPDGRPGGKKRIADPAIQAVESGRIKFVPESWSTTYFQWLRNIQDWCISRQLWWGHRIPAWYDSAGNVYVARSEAEARAKYKLDASVELTQDGDTFDTWFSSDLWPLATLGWPDNTEDLKRYYPTSVLVTGFDIIFFWVARMVMMGQFFTGQVPFREVFITGLIRDAEGQKMSKSKGNILDPLDLVDGIALEDLVAKRTAGLMQPQMARKIEQATRKQFPQGIQALGVDAQRFTFAALCSPGRDIRFDASRAEGYRNFCNKLWNAARFVLMNCEEKDCGLDAGDPVALSAADKWIVSRLQKVEQDAAEHFAAYRFDLLAQSLYQFVWNEYCDWYLELAKPALQSADPAAQRGTRRTLVRVLEATLRLLHPLMPFVTEDIWQRVAPLAGKSLSEPPCEAGRRDSTIMLQPYPVAEPSKIDEAAEDDIAWVQEFVLGVRRIRGEMDLPPGKPLPVLLQNATKTDAARMQRLRTFVEFLARIEEPYFLEPEEKAPQSAVALLGEMKILVPIAGLIDKDAELTRLARQIGKLEQELARGEQQLANPNFGKAPAHIQDGARAQVAAKRKELDALKAQEQRIRAL